MRVLVTGAAGFIGSHVTRRIVQEGHEVWAAVRPGATTERIAGIPTRVNLVPADLRDDGRVRELIATARPDCTIHLAWYGEPGKYWAAPDNLDCVAMTLNLARRLAESGCPRLVAAGTCAEYDWNYGFLSEAVTPLSPRTLYGACKNAAREILESFCAQKSISFAWTRLFYLYGPGEPRQRLVPSVILALIAGQPARCTSGEQIRDYLHVDDVAAAIWSVAQSDVTGAVNIGSGEPVRVRTIVETIAEILHREDQVMLGALPADPSEPPFLVADVRRLKQATGLEPLWKLKEGLRQAVSWWQQKPEQERGSVGTSLESLGGQS